MKLDNRITDIDRDLISNPYKINLLFEKFLVLNLLKDNINAEAVLDTLSNFPGIDQQVKNLNLLLEHEKQSSFENNIWFLFPSHSSNENRELLTQHALNHYTTLSSITKKPNSLIIIDLVPLPYSSVDTSINGLNIISVSGLEASIEEMSAALLHELSHVFFPCKNRVLSEGIALFYENKLASSHSIITSYDDVIRFVSNYCGTIPSLDSLLSSLYEGDVFFDQKTENKDEQKLVYNLAFLLINAFIEQNGEQKLDLLINNINQNESSQTKSIYLSYFNSNGFSFDSLIGDIQSDKTQGFDIALIEKILYQDRLNHQYKAYEKFYKVFNQKTNSLDLIEHKILQGKMLLTVLNHQIFYKKKIDMMILQEVETIATILQKQGASIEADYFTARSECTRLINCENGIEKAIFGSRARSSFDNALNKDSALYSECCIDFAIFELYIPREYGQDIGHVKTLLDEIKCGSKYDKEVENIKQFFEVA